MHVLLIPLAAFVLAIVLHIAVIGLFPRLGLLDFPERYGLKRARLPYPSGIASVLAFIAIFAWLEPLDRSALGVLAGIVILCAFSFLDDRRPLPAGLRFVLQIGVTLLIFLTGDCTGGRICSLTNPLEGILGGPIVELNGLFPILSLLVTCVWLMVTINALNWFDGVPGQVSTLSFLGFLVIGLLSLLRNDQVDIALLAFCLAAIAFAAACFDVRGPRVILGDTGAMFFGLMLGVLTIYSGGKLATAFLALGFPIIDSVLVVLRRLRSGRSPMQGKDGEHLHNRLMAIGWSRQMIIGITAAIGTAFGAIALFLNTQGKVIAALILLSVILGLSMYADMKRKTKLIIDN
jgi:UDP-GlcNAc:undecaprenyl-phosphate/decaprenyl-phosphate GlcNAc-1-phosphate transferase